MSPPPVQSRKSTNLGLPSLVVSRPAAAMCAMCRVCIVFVWCVWCVWCVRIVCVTCQVTPRVEDPYQGSAAVRLAASLLHQLVDSGLHGRLCRGCVRAPKAREHRPRCVANARSTESRGRMHKPGRQARAQQTRQDTLRHARRRRRRAVVPKVDAQKSRLSEHTATGRLHQVRRNKFLEYPLWLERCHQSGALFSVAPPSRLPQSLSHGRSYPGRTPTACERRWLALAPCHVSRVHPEKQHVEQRSLRGKQRAHFHFEPSAPFCHRPCLRRAV